MIIILIIYNELHMILYIILLLIFVAWLFLVIYWLPSRKHKWHADNFRKQGYRVLELPFNPFKMSTLNFYGYANNTQDSLSKVKETYPDYDVVVMNIYRSTFLDLLHPELHQEVLSAKKAPIYQKLELTKSVLSRGMGIGLFFS